MEFYLSVDDKDVRRAFAGLSADVGKRGIGIAARKATKPVLDILKLNIASILAGEMIPEGIQDFQDSLKIVRRNYPMSVYVSVAPDMDHKVPSSNHKGMYTRWFKLAHIFEGGTSDGKIKPYNIFAITKLEVETMVLTTFALTVKEEVFKAAKRARARAARKR